MTPRQVITHLVPDGILAGPHGVCALVAAPAMRHGDAATTRVNEQVLSPLPTAIPATPQHARGTAGLKIVRRRTAGRTPWLLAVTALLVARSPGLGVNLDSQSRRALPGQ